MKAIGSESKNFVSVYVALFILWGLFLFVAPLFGLAALVLGLPLIIANLIMIWRLYKRQLFLHMAAVGIIFIFGIIVLFLPATHVGFTYDKNGQTIVVPHKHFFWQMGHIH